VADEKNPNGLARQQKHWYVAASLFLYETFSLSVISIPLSCRIMLLFACPLMDRSTISLSFVLSLAAFRQRRLHRSCLVARALRPCPVLISLVVVVVVVVVVACWEVACGVALSRRRLTPWGAYLIFVTRFMWSSLLHVFIGAVDWDVILQERCPDSRNICTHSMDERQSTNETSHGPVCPVLVQLPRMNFSLRFSNSTCLFLSIFWLGHFEFGNLFPPCSIRLSRMSIFFAILHWFL
jgi:hypothetical protein